MARDISMKDLVIEYSSNYKNEFQQILTNLSKGKGPSGWKLMNKNFFVINLEKIFK